MLFKNSKKFLYEIFEDVEMYEMKITENIPISCYDTEFLTYYHKLPKSWISKEKWKLLKRSYKNNPKVKQKGMNFYQFILYCLKLEIKVYKKNIKRFFNISYRKSYNNFKILKKSFYNRI